MTQTHPSGGIAAALAACRRRGLVIVRSGHGLTWGWVECATGARRLAVPARPTDDARHGRRIMIFLEGHYTHRPRRRRPRASGGAR